MNIFTSAAEKNPVLQIDSYSFPKKSHFIFFSFIIFYFTILYWFYHKSKF